MSLPLRPNRAPRMRPIPTTVVPGFNSGAYLNSLFSSWDAPIEAFDFASLEPDVELPDAVPATPAASF